jgi:hypothetical protein
VQVYVVCSPWTAFYLDKYDRDKHRAQLLDFIEGHNNEHQDLELLRTWTARLGDVCSARVSDPAARTTRVSDPAPCKHGPDRPE